MNKMKYLLLIVICTIVAGTVTSCLSNDDNNYVDNRMTQEEWNIYKMRIVGQYYGKLKYIRQCRTYDNKKDSTKVDSIQQIHWSVNADSTITITNFPDSIYNQSITGNSDFQKVLAKAPTQPLKCLYLPYKGTTATGTTDYGFYIVADGKWENPYYYVERKFSVDEKTYTVNYGYVESAYDASGYICTSTGYVDKNGNANIMLMMKHIKCNDVPSFTSNLSLIKLEGQKIY